MGRGPWAAWLTHREVLASPLCGVGSPRVVLRKGCHAVAHWGCCVRMDRGASGGRETSGRRLRTPGER